MAFFAPTIFVNHGGGPLPVLGEKHNHQIAESLRDIKNQVDLKSLNAIIVVSAHREEEIVTISSGKVHELIYDYSNYPPESYTWKYPAPGHPELAGEIHEALKEAGINSQLDDKRGWDHGVFIPMMLINPDANIPIIQVSLLKYQNAKDHLAIGKVLYRFREKGVAIIGSGMTYHNMAELVAALKSSNAGINDGVVTNEIFDDFLNEACTKGLEDELLKWDQKPQALYCHPKGKAEHFMPLFVCFGAAGKSTCKNIFSSVFLEKFKLSGFMWS